MNPREKVHDLYRLFSRKCSDITRGGTSELEDRWLAYLSSLGCQTVSRTRVAYGFVQLMNEGTLRGEVVCIPDPFSVSLSGGRRAIDGKGSDSEHCDYILVPLETALKALVLETLPDLEPWLDSPSDPWDELPAGPDCPYDE